MCAPEFEREYPQYRKSLVDAGNAPQRNMRNAQRRLLERGAETFFARTAHPSSRLRLMGDSTRDQPAPEGHIWKRMPENMAIPQDPVLHQKDTRQRRPHAFLRPVGRDRGVPITLFVSRGRFPRHDRSCIDRLNPAGGNRRYACKGLRWPEDRARRHPLSVHMWANAPSRARTTTAQHSCNTVGRTLE